MYFSNTGISISPEASSSFSDYLTLPSPDYLTNLNTNNNEEKENGDDDDNNNEEEKEEEEEDNNGTKRRWRRRTMTPTRRRRRWRTTTTTRRRRRKGVGNLNFQICPGKFSDLSMKIFGFV